MDEFSGSTDRNKVKVLTFKQVCLQNPPLFTKHAVWVCPSKDNTTRCVESLQHWDSGTQVWHLFPQWQRSCLNQETFDPLHTNSSVSQRKRKWSCFRASLSSCRGRLLEIGWTLPKKADTFWKLHWTTGDVQCVWLLVQGPKHEGT